MYHEQTCGRLIVLNGASSAGKTSIAVALQPLLGPRCVQTGLDDMLARTQPFGPEPQRPVDQFRRALRILRFQLTNGRVRLAASLHRQVADMVRAGQDVIVDTALIDQPALRDAARCFAPLHGLFVGVRPPLEISEQWERMRGDRPIGQARRHYALVHAHGIYDLILDTSALTSQECAQAIVRRLREGPASAFQRLVSGNNHSTQ